MQSLKSPQVVQRPIGELTDVLKYVMIKVGLRQQNWPHEIEKAVLVEHIVKYFGGHTHEEIKLAFDLAINGELEFPEKEDANHYENFSCAYFSKIINAYRVWASQTHKNIIKDKPMLPEIKEDMSDEAMIEWWNQTEAMVNKGNYHIDLIPPGLYEWMDKNGNITTTKEEKIELIEKATITRHSAIAYAYEKNPHSLEAKRTLTEFNKMRETKLYSHDENERIKGLAKKMVVFKMMKR